MQKVSILTILTFLMLHCQTVNGSTGVVVGIKDDLVTRFVLSFGNKFKDQIGNIQIPNQSQSVSVLGISVSVNLVDGYAKLNLNPSGMSIAFKDPNKIILKIENQSP